LPNTFFDWEEYAIWHLAPRVGVGMDGRRETVYPDAAYRDYLSWTSGRGDWNLYLALGPADMARVPGDRAGYNLLDHSPAWERAYQDEMAALFARRDFLGAALLCSTTPSDVPTDERGMSFP